MNDVNTKYTKNTKNGLHIAGGSSQSSKGIVYNNFDDRKIRGKSLRECFTYTSINRLP